MKLLLLRRAWLAPVLLLPTLVESFVLLPSNANAIVSPILHLTYDPYGEESDALARNKARTDVRNLLTQRSIQSFVYLLNKVRDVHTAAWIEKVLEFKKLDTFHGTGALDMSRFPSWDSFFLDMVTMDKETVVVLTKKQKRKARGWSNKAGYLDDLAKKSGLERGFKGSQQESPVRSKTGSSLPKRSHRGYNNAGYLSNLSSSVLKPGIDGKKKKRTGRKTRNERRMKKMAQKLKKQKSQPRSNASNYLDNIGKNPIDKKPETIKSEKVAKPSQSSRKLSGTGYLSNLHMQKSEPKKEKTKKKVQNQNVKPHMQEKSEYEQKYEFDIDPTSLVNRIISVREQLSREWVIDLETLVFTNDEILTSYLDRQMEARKEEVDDQEIKDLTSPYSDRSSKEATLVFDRNAMTMLANSIATQGYDSSPFRLSNFDLLLLLSTQESIHRVLREYSAEDAEEDFDWLKDFYSERVGNFFDGHGQGHGRADDFLKELLLCPPTVQTTNEGIHLIDPMKMVEDIIRERSEVAREWKMLVSKIPDDHIDLRRLILTRRMMEVDDMPTLSTKPEAGAAGAFE